MFNDMLKAAMDDAGMSVRDLANATGLPVTTIGRYIRKKTIPTEERKEELALALGLAPDYFKACGAEILMQDGIKQYNLTIETAANLMGTDTNFIRKGLQQGVFPFGCAVKATKSAWEYYISPVKFAEYTGCVIVEPDDLVIEDD